MKMLIATVMAVLAVVCALTFSPELRHKAEDVLFGEQQADAVKQPGGETGRRSDRLADMVKEAPGKIHQKVAALTDDPSPETPTGQQTISASEPEPETPSGPPPTRQTDPPRNQQTEPARAREPTPQRPSVRISLPPPLHKARFGISEAQVRSLYPIAWESNDYTGSGEGTRLLVHHITEDKTRSARFRLYRDSLFEITVHLEPGEGQTLDALYDHWRRRFAEQYAGLPEARRTRWSDGTTRINIGLNRTKNFVWIEFQCPAAREQATRPSDG
ncbi:MAG: hypothetical protein R6X33_06780 [Candidatus Brocadiia bacterium]